MNTLLRRIILRSVLGLAIATLAGCTQSDSAESTPTGTKIPSTSSTTEIPAQPFVTPAAGECEITQRPNPDKAENVAAKPYPSYPEELTLDSGKKFALKYEEALQQNLYLSENDGSAIQDLSIAVWSPFAEQTDRGYLIGVEGELAATEGESITDVPISSVYYLTSELALQGETGSLSDVDSLSSEEIKNARTIYCQSIR